MRNKQQLRTYQRGKSIIFRTTRGPFGGFSNFAAGFPLTVNGHLIHSTEALYQACKFPHRVRVQQMIIRENNPKLAKAVSIEYAQESRKDWSTIRVSVMRWCLRVKAAQHYSRLVRLLELTDHLPIVEESHRDSFWGAAPIDGGLLQGINALGRLWMQVRDELLTSLRETEIIVRPPRISNFLLLGEPVRTISVHQTVSWSQGQLRIL